MPKIYIFVNEKLGSGDVIGLALAEDGHCLASHLSSHEGFLKFDMGLTSTRKHEAYKNHYPEGFELVWVDDAINSKEVEEAYLKNQALKP